MVELGYGPVVGVFTVGEAEAGEGAGIAVDGEDTGVEALAVFMTDDISWLEVGDDTGFFCDECHWHTGCSFCYSMGGIARGKGVTDRSM